MKVNPVELGNRHAWTLTLPALENVDKLVALGIWIYVTYKCFNHQRAHGSPLKDEDLHRALNQWMKEAAKNTSGVNNFLKKLWPKGSHENGKPYPHEKKRRRKANQGYAEPHEIHVAKRRRGSRQ